VHLYGLDLYKGVEILKSDLLLAVSYQYECTYSTVGDIKIAPPQQKVTKVWPFLSVVQNSTVSYFLYWMAPGST
jgi:hypothetical protein